MLTMRKEQKSWIKVLLRHPIFFLIIFAGIVRLHNVTNEPLDWHAFRQADTASVTREYVKHGINLLRPTYHDLSNIQSGKDNPEGLRMVEFPFVNALLAAFIRLTDAPLALTSRLFSIACSLGAMYFLHRIVRTLSGEPSAFLTALIFAFMPYAIFYSRVILPEPTMLFLFLGSLWFYMRWLKQRKPHLAVLSTVFLAGAFLMKPFVAFIAPVFIAATWFLQKRDWYKEWPLIFIGGASILPFVWWRGWIAQFPEGIPANTWLFNGNGIRFRPAWFRWLFWERLTKLMAGFSGALLSLGVLLARGRDLVVYAVWWIGILAYFSVMATGNVQHDYYQVLAIPILCVTIARGTLELHSVLQRRLPTTLVKLTLSFALVLGGLISWNTTVSGYFSINHWEYIEAGQAVNELTPPDAKVIAPAFGDTMFLFQTNRTGWPIGFNIPEKISLGATHYVTTSYDDEARELEKQFQTIKKTEKFLLLDLTKKI